jgi:hypothetical protein
MVVPEQSQHRQRYIEGAQILKLTAAGLGANSKGRGAQRVVQRGLWGAKPPHQFRVYYGEWGEGCEVPVPRVVRSARNSGRNEQIVIAWPCPQITTIGFILVPVVRAPSLVRSAVDGTATRRPTRLAEPTVAFH